MEEVRICDYCGRVLAEEEGTPVDDELLCDDCVEEHCVTCLCQDCFDAHYYRCESCGQIVPESLVCWHSDLPYCERCFDEFEDEIEELLMDTAAMEEAICEAKTLLQCEA